MIKSYYILWWRRRVNYLEISKFTIVYWFKVDNTNISIRYVTEKELKKLSTKLTTLELKSLMVKVKSCHWNLIKPMLLLGLPHISTFDLQFLCPVLLFLVLHFSCPWIHAPEFLPLPLPLLMPVPLFMPLLLLLQLDSDGDGQLSFDEFRVLFENAEKRKLQEKEAHGSCSYKVAHSFKHF